MLTVPAVKVQQFKQEFFLLNLSAIDVQRLVRFEVLGEAGLDGAHRGARRARPTHWVGSFEWEGVRQKYSTKGLPATALIPLQRSPSHSTPYRGVARRAFIGRGICKGSVAETGRASEAWLGSVHDSDHATALIPNILQLQTVPTLPHDGDHRRVWPPPQARPLRPNPHLHTVVVSALPRHCVSLTRTAHP